MTFTARDEILRPLFLAHPLRHIDRRSRCRDAGSLPSGPEPVVEVTLYTAESSLALAEILEAPGRRGHDRDHQSARSFRVLVHPSLRRHLRPPRSRLPRRGRDGLPLHTRGRRPSGRPRAHTGTGHGDRTKEGIRDPRRHRAADRPHRRRPALLLGEEEAPRDERPGPRGPSGPSHVGFGRTTWSCARSRGSPGPRHPRRPDCRRHQVLGGQGVSRRRSCSPRPVPR